MSSYTITIMRICPGELLPKVVNIRNTYQSMSDQVGGDPVLASISTWSVEGVVKISSGGPGGPVVFARDDHRGHWKGLTRKDQKSVMEWFIRNPGYGRLCDE